MSDSPAESAAARRLDAIDDVLGRITAGESPAAIRRGLVPASWAPVLARVAVAGRFSQGIYDDLLTAIAPAGPPALDTLAETGLVTHAPGRPGWFVMPPEDGEVWAAALPDRELTVLETELAEVHLRRGDQVEAVQHLINGSPERGRELLESLLAEADAQLNLPRYQDILGAAQNSKSSTGADLAEFIASHTAYLNARSMWLTDYYRSAQFLAPPGFVDRGRDFTTAAESRVWHIVGPGGTGKTMQLRWLVSRLWVPQPASTPCARVDFDTVALEACARFPFLILIMLAEQLAEQLPQNPFSHFLRSYEPFLRLATRRVEWGTAPPSAQATLVGQRIPWDFASCCQAVGDTPIVVILDTLEELSLRYPAETVTLLEQFRQVSQQVPGLRLVFVSRYEIPALSRLFAGVSPQWAEPFSRDQADAYLEQIRGITSAERRAELIERADGLPFVLAMYADLVTADPAVRLDDIGQGLEPRLVYLAERIIDRIPQPMVRWLLRYGWVPRRLTRSYVRDVLAPFLIRASSGDRTLDDPMLDPITEWRGRRLFPTDLADLQAELDRAWDDLKTYASSSSWVTGVTSDPDTVLLKAEMLAPMRAILTSRPVLRELHLRSAGFYRELAGTDPEHRPQFLNETIYHLAQARSADLVLSWQEFADQAREAGDYLALADLSAEVTAPEYADESGEPRRLAGRGGEELVPGSLMIEAHLWRAYAAQAQVIRQLQGGTFAGWQADSLWTVVRREHEAATRLAWSALPAWVADQPPGRRDLLSRGERLVSAALALADGHPRQALDIAGGLTGAQDDITLCAEALRVAAAPLAGEDVIPLQERLTYRELFAGRPATSARSAGVLADRLVAVGDIGHAASLVNQVNTATGLMRDTYLSVLIERGTPAAALRRVDSSDPSPERALAIGWREVQAHLALRQPERALRLLEGYEERLRRLTNPVTQLRERAFSLEVRGITCGALLQLDAAATAFEESASLWLELGHPDGHLRSRRHHAETLLHEAGDVSVALTLLQGLTSQLDDGAESAAVLQLTAEALTRSGQPEPAREMAERLLRRSQAGARPLHRDRVLASIAGLIATGDTDRYGPPLLSSLRNVRPGTARLRLLEQLRWCPDLSDHPITEVLDEVAVADPSEDPADQTVHALQRAYVAKVCDDPRLKGWLEGVIPDGPSYLACEVLRWFPDRAPSRTAVLAERYLSTGSGGGTLAAMVHLRLAQRHLLRRLPPAEVDRLVRTAESEIDAAGRPSRWLAEFYELSGSVALGRGDLYQAARLFERAHAVQQRLGNRVAERALEASLAIAQERGGGIDLGASTPEDATELVVHSVQADPGAIDRPGSADLSAMRVAIEDARNSSTVPVRSDAVVRVESPELDVLWQPWELAADRVYRAQPLRGSRGRDIAWLRWALTQAVLPPELREDCRRVIAGESLSQSLRERVELELSGPDRRRRVVIIRSSREAEESWGYSHEARGLNLLTSYLSAGWDAQEFTPAQARQSGPRALLRAGPPDVIHLAARMEVSATLSWFDTSEESIVYRGHAKGMGTDTGIFATEVIGWLAEIGRASEGSAPPPVVVLDPVAAPSSRGNLDLLGGRNRFAASVYLDGMAMAVVATGLAGRDPLASQQAWLEAMAHGVPLEAVVGRLRQLADPEVPPALFAPSRSYTI